MSRTLKLTEGAASSYHGNFLDPQDNTPQVIRWAHAENVIFRQNGSVLLLGKLYDKRNFDAFPKELGFAQLGTQEASDSREEINRRIKELEDERSKLDEAQAIAKDQPPDRPGRIADLLQHFRKGSPVNIRGGDEFEAWRASAQERSEQKPAESKAAGKGKETK